VVYHPAVPTNLLTTAQAAKILKVTRQRVLAMIAAGRLTAERIGVQWVIRPADLDKVKDRKTGRPPMRKPARPARAKGGGKGGAK
jgi:excisionase family DNA binding protein